MNVRAKLVIAVASIAAAFVTGCGSPPDEQHSDTTDLPLCTSLSSLHPNTLCSGDTGGGGGTTCYQAPLNTSYSCWTGAYFPYWDSNGAGYTRADLQSIGCYNFIDYQGMGWSRAYNAALCPYNATTNNYVQGHATYTTEWNIFESTSMHDTCLNAAPCGYVWVFFRDHDPMSPGGGCGSNCF